MSLPNPEPIFKHTNFMGRWIIKPMEYGAMDNGLQFSVEDIYEIVSETEALFEKRTKKYIEPHNSKAEFKACSRCKNARKYGYIPETEILMKRGEDSGF